MRILVTGAFGNLGRSAVAELLSRGLAVRCFDLPTPGNRLRARVFAHRGSSLEVVWGDITHHGDVARAVDGVHGVLHCAAILPPWSERAPARARAVNVGGLQNLLRALEAEPRTLVYPSSFSVFGPDAGRRGPATAESPVLATDAYTAHKLECEAALRGSRLPWSILRLGAALEGSAAAVDTAILRLMLAIDPEQPMEVVHGRDVARALVNALLEPAAHRRVLLVGGGPSCQIRQRDLTSLMLRMMGVDALPEEAFGRLAYYTCWMDTRGSEALLHYQRASFAEVSRDLEARFAALGPVLRAARPLTRRLLLRLSDALRGRASPGYREIFSA